MSAMADAQKDALRALARELRSDLEIRHDLRRRYAAKIDEAATHAPATLAGLPAAHYPLGAAGPALYTADQMREYALARADAVAPEGALRAALWTLEREAIAGTSALFGDDCTHIDECRRREKEVVEASELLHAALAWQPQAAGAGGDAVVVAPEMIEAFRVACRALIRERKVYAEDVFTLADVLRVLQKLVEQPATCDRPPAGWHCGLPRDHDGPCPAWPVSHDAATPAPAVAGGDAVLAQLRRELAADKGADYTQYEQGRIAEKRRCIDLLAATPPPAVAQDEARAVEATTECRGPGFCEACSRAAGCCFKGERCGRRDCPAPATSFPKPAPCPSAAPAAETGSTGADHG